MRSSLRRLALLLGGVLAAALAFAPSAAAHATVVSSDPADGARVASVPATVSVTFDEAVSLNGVGYLRVVDQSGRDVETGAATHPGGDATQIGVGLKPGLSAGTFTMSYRVISADSHPVAGALRFVVGDGALVTAGVGAPSSTNDVTGFAFDVARWAAFGGLALIGGAWLLATVWPAGRDDRRSRRLLWTGWGAATVGALAELLLQGPYTAGRGLGSLTDGSLLDATLHTAFGTAHSIRLLLLGILGVALAALLRARWRPELAQIAGGLTVGVVLTYAVSGHATAENPRWLAVGSDTVHLAAMAAWLGGLVYLLACVLPRNAPDELSRALPVFSRTAFGCVAALAATGTYQAWLGVGSIDALTSTRYGQLVLVKAGLFVVLVALGNLSRIAVSRRYVRTIGFGRTEPAPSAPGPDAPRRLRRAVLAEVALGVAVLAVTAVLVAEPPGRAAAAAQAAAPRTVNLALGAGRTATVSVRPGKHGPVGVTLALNPGAKPLSVTLTAALAARQLGPIPVPLTTKDGLNYSADNVLLPAGGTWTFTANVRTTEFDAVTADGSIHLS